MKVKVGIVGCGVVGTGVVELLLKNSDKIRKKTGIDLQISKVGDKDWKRPRPFMYQRIKNYGLQRSD